MNPLIKSSIRASLVFGALVLVGAGCTAKNSVTTPSLPTVITSSTVTAINATTNQIRFFALKNSNNPANSEYLEQATTTPNTVDPRRAAVEAAVANLPNVVYFKIQGDDAYILLSSHLDASASNTAKNIALQALIEKNLKQFPGIKRVTFDVAPGDNKADLQKK